MAPGTYEVFAEYNLDPKSNKYLHTRIGRGEVQSVLFDKGKPMLRMGEMVLPMDSALEFYDKNTTRQEKEQRENAAHFVPQNPPKPQAPTQATKTKPASLASVPDLAKGQGRANLAAQAHPHSPTPHAPSTAQAQMPKPIDALKRPQSAPCPAPKPNSPKRNTARPKPSTARPKHSATRCVPKPSPHKWTQCV